MRMPERWMLRRTATRCSSWKSRQHSDVCALVSPEFGAGWEKKSNEMPPSGLSYSRRNRFKNAAAFLSERLAAELGLSYSVVDSMQKSTQHYANLKTVEERQKSRISVLIPQVAQWAREKRNFIIIDDSVASGTTLNNLQQKLRESGAGTIVIYAVARIHPDGHLDFENRINRWALRHNAPRVLAGLLNNPLAHHTNKILHYVFELVPTEFGTLLSLIELHARSYLKEIALNSADALEIPSHSLSLLFPQGLLPPHLMRQSA